MWCESGEANYEEMAVMTRVPPYPLPIAYHVSPALTQYAMRIRAASRRITGTRREVIVYQYNAKVSTSGNKLLTRYFVKKQIRIFRTCSICFLNISLKYLISNANILLRYPVSEARCVCTSLNFYYFF